MTNARPALVSVIIPFLNTERFLREAIESVFAQTYEEWEMLLVDDGSTDGSTAIAQEYAGQHHERVRYLEHDGHQNRGMSASRNLGIRNAKGKYIAFLDADDVWLPCKLEQQVTILESQPEAAMVYGLDEFWYSWAGNQDDNHRDFIHKLGMPSNTLIHPPTLFTHFFLAQDAAIPGPTNILVQREAIERVGGFEDSFRGSYEDEVFYAKVCLKSPVFVVDTCWARYRQHSDSSNSIIEEQGKQYSSRLLFLKWLAVYLRMQGVMDAKLLWAIRWQQWQCLFPILDKVSKSIPQLLRRIQAVGMNTARHLLPAIVRRKLWAIWTGTDYIPPIGWVRFGSLRRVTPLSREFGYDRGRPIDRYYIEQFLGEHRKDVRGRVLEIADNAYTCRFGGDRVEKGDVLHLQPGNPQATIVADLTHADHIPANTYDCIILTQTLQFIFDVPAALRTIHRILKPGGVVLATMPGISPISRYDMERWGHFWVFTSLSARRLFEQFFHTGKVEISSYGNVLAASAFLFGMATEELKQQEIEYCDPDYEVTIAIRAVK